MIYVVRVFEKKRNLQNIFDPEYIGKSGLETSFFFLLNWCKDITCVCVLIQNDVISHLVCFFVVCVFLMVKRPVTFHSLELKSLVIKWITL